MMCNDDLDDPFDDYVDDEAITFAQAGSALRAATPDNPRIHPCPSCGDPNRLTPADVQLGYQCDRCADMAEGLIPQW